MVPDITKHHICFVVSSILFKNSSSSSFIFSYVTKFVTRYFTIWVDVCHLLVNFLTGSVYQTDAFHSKNSSNQKIIDRVFRCPMLHAWYYALSWICECCHIHCYRLVLGDEKLDFCSSLSPANGNSLKTHCWAWWLQMSLENCKCINFLQWIKHNLFEFISKILLHISQVGDGNRLYLDLIWWLSTSASPSFASLSPIV